MVFGFKVGRCGSTLLLRMLLRDRRFWVVGEPSVLNRIQENLPGDEFVTLRGRLYRALVFHLAQPFFPWQVMPSMR